MKKTFIKIEKRERRKKQIRARVFGSASIPRLSVFKSNKHLLAQLIDDYSGSTLVFSSSNKVSGKTPMEKSFAVGLDLAKKAKEKKIEKVVFDRGGFMYTGNIEALASGAREGGLVF